MFRHLTRSFKRAIQLCASKSVRKYRFQPLLAGIILFFAACTALPTGNLPPFSSPSPAPISPTPPLDPTIATLSIGETQFPIDMPEGSPTLPLRGTQPVRSPTASPPSPTPSPTSTPAPRLRLLSDLLFLSGNRLVRWDKITNYPDTLTDGVEAFSVSANGQKVALLRKRSPSPTEENLYNLEMLDLQTQRIMILVEKVHPLVQMQLSPDGRWIAYMLESGALYPMGGGSIFVLSAESPTEPIEMGICHSENEAHCAQLAWSPDSLSLLWNDQDGLWLSTLDRPSSRLVHPNQVEVTDPKGEKSTVSVTFSAPVWSPGGRFVLTHIIPSASGVHWHAVVDTRSGRMEAVPDTDEYAMEDITPIIKVDWMPDGYFWVAHSNDPALGEPPFIKLWQVVATHTNMMVLIQSFTLQPDACTHADLVHYSYGPDWLARYDEKTLLIGIHALGIDLPGALYRLDQMSGGATCLHQLPINPTRVLWSPDGLGALVLGEEGQLFFAPTDGSPLRELSTLFGQAAHGFIWMAPVPRHQ